ncbi:MAG: glycosyltransferase family A protein [Pseudomonadota bacterium]
MSTGILITSFNRYKYFKKTLHSLSKSNLFPDCEILIIDDASTDSRVIKFIKSFSIKNIKIEIFFNKQNKGVSSCLRDGFDFLIKKKHEYLTNLDNDVLLDPLWLTKLHETFSKLDNKTILSGFNSSNIINHPIIKKESGLAYKSRIGGINLFFHRSLYSFLIRDNLKPFWDDLVSEAMQKNNLSMVCLIPSVIQHTGKSGLWSTHASYDYAIDFHGKSRLLLNSKSFVEKAIASKMVSLKNLIKLFLQATISKIGFNIY